MLPPPDQNVRLSASSARGDWGAGAAGVGDRAEPLKSHARGTVWRAEVLGQVCVLKCVRLDSARRRLQSLTRLSPAWRQWRGARWLRAHGFSTGEPLAIVTGRAQGTPVECLIVQHLTGRSILEHAAAGDLPSRRRRDVARGVGRLAGRLAREGRFNRDAKPSNLIVTSLGETGVHLGIIDCGDLRRCRRGGRRAVARMLAAAVIEPLGCGVTISPVLRARAVRAAAETLDPSDERPLARSLWREIAAIIAAHGDATPHDDPLSPPRR